MCWVSSTAHTFRPHQHVLGDARNVELGEGYDGRWPRAGCSRCRLGRPGRRCREGSQAGSVKLERGQIQQGGRALQGQPHGSEPGGVYAQGCEGMMENNRLGGDCEGAGAEAGTEAENCG